MGVHRLDALRCKAVLALRREQNIDDLRTTQVPALDQHVFRPHAQQHFASPAHLVFRADLGAAQGCRFRRIGGQQIGVRQHQRLQCIDRAFAHQGMAPLGDHDRVDHLEGRRRQQHFCDGFHGRNIGQHARLDGIGADIVETGARLGGNEVWRNRHDIADAQRILHCQSGNRRHGVAAEHCHSLDVGLNTRPAARIRTGDNQNSVHGGTFRELCIVTKSAHKRGVFPLSG